MDRSIRPAASLAASVERGMDSYFRRHVLGVKIHAGVGIVFLYRRRHLDMITITPRWSAFTTANSARSG
jgi:hypothetical protein